MDLLSSLKSDEKIRMVALTFLTIFCVFLEIILHFYLGISTGYTHFFYILLVLAAIWYQRKAVILAICLAVTHFSIGYFAFDEPLWVPFLRSAMFVLVTLLVAIMSEGQKKAETAVCVKAHEWERTFNASSDGICLLDNDQKILRCNQSMGSMLNGTPVQDLTGKNCWEIVHKTTGPIVECPFVAAKKTLTRHTTEVHEGDKWFEVTADPILDDSGAFTGAVHIMRDITERKRIEESLQQSHQILQTILDTIPVRVFWKDRDLKYLGCNLPFAQDAGFNEPKELIGRDDYAMGWRDQAEIYRADDRSVITSGKAKVMIEEPQKTPDGRIIWLLTSKVPLRDAMGEISGVLGTYMDISEFRNAKEAIRESEEKYRAFFATSKDSVFITSKDGRFEDFNDETPAFFGYFDREEFGTVRVQDLYSIASDRQEHIRAIEQSGFVKDYAVDLRKKDGSIIHALITSIARKNISGEVIGFQGTIKDITEQKRAEEARRESERKFRDLFENSRDGIIFADIKTHKFVDSNEMFSFMLGYNPEEIRALSITDIHPEERLSYILDVFEKMMKHEITVIENIPVKRKDGTIFYADISAYPVNISGKGYLAGIFRDITERRKGEEALAQSERKFHTMADFTFDWEYWLAPDSSFVYISPSCKGITGYSPKEFIADPALITRIVHPDDAPLVSDHFNRIHKSPETGILDFRIVGRDGKTHWLAHSCQPVYDGSGTYLGRRASNRDITDRKRAEEALKESEEKYRLFTEKSNDIIYSMDPAGNFTYVSPQVSRYGYTPEEIISGGLSSVILAEDLPRVLEDTRITVSTGKPTATIFRVRDKSGAIVWLEDNDTGVYDSSGKVIAVFGIIRDITERKRAEEALKESNERYVSYIKEAAMRLKTPVEVVERNITGIIQDINAGDIDSNQVLLQLQIQVKNMEQIRQNIIDLNKTIVDGYGEISPASKKFLTE